MNRSFQSSRHYAPHVALILVQLIFGTWPIVGKIALRSLSSTALVGLRVTGAAVSLYALQRLMGGSLALERRDIPRLALYSLLGVVLNQLLYIKGLSLTTVINANLISATIPAFTLLVSILIGHDRLTLSKSAGLALAALGIIYLINPSRADFSSGTTQGNLLILANSASYGSYIALSKDVLRRYSALTVIAWIFILGSIAAIPIGGFALSQTSFESISTEAWLAVLYIILMPTVVAYYLNAWSLARVAPSIVAVYIYLQPLIAFALAPLILGERWNSRTWVASALIFAGLYLVMRRTRRSREAISETTEHPEALSH